MSQSLLTIKDLVVVFNRPRDTVKAINNLELEIAPGEVLALVGESGCGKTLTALCILGLLPQPGHITSGRIFFQGQNLLALSPNQLRKLRGSAISMVFQDSMTSLNPVLTIGYQIAEQMLTHIRISKQEAWSQTIEILGQVGIPDPSRRATDFPYQLSGGMRQRVIIAMALIMKPQLLIADEPTTALDVTIQAQILNLLYQLQNQNRTAILFISHNLAIIAQIADRIAVMYGGRILELALAKELFSHPLHPYTQGLLSCLLIDTVRPGTRLPTITGVVPPLDELPSGCVFSNRCLRHFNSCQIIEPALVKITSNHQVRCYLYHNQQCQ